MYRELVCLIGYTVRVAGLSLCVQGTPNTKINLFIIVRFIPVCTGNTAGFLDELINFPVYPCAYRELSASRTLSRIICGLSLCIQGTPHYTDPELVRCRFIPVHTGNTIAANLIFGINSVYPCVYRERITSKNTILVNFGLSLCIQGTLFPSSCRRILIRFIPVHTGNAQYKPFLVQRVTVYPCAYRERFTCFNCCLISVGLSLCVQGTRFFSCHFNLLFRFIPVHTGNSPIITYCFIFKILAVKFLPIF